MPDCLILPKYHEFPRITTIERTFSWAAAWSSNLGIWYIDTSIPLRIGIQYGLSFTMIQFCSCFSPDMSLNFLSKAALYPELPAVEVLELSSLDICYVSTHKPPTFEFQLQTTDHPTRNLGSARFRLHSKALFGIKEGNTKCLLTHPHKPRLHMKHAPHKPAWSWSWVNRFIKQQGETQNKRAKEHLYKQAIGAFAILNDLTISGASGEHAARVDKTYSGQIWLRALSAIICEVLAFNFSDCH